MENQLLTSLRKNKLLKNVDISKLDLRNVRGKLITISEGEILYREGDYADQIYLVVSGEVNLLKKRLLGKTKSFIFNENDFFGQEEFMEEMSRTSTSVALRDTYLISLSKEEIDELSRLDNNVFLNMREPMAETDEETSQKNVIKSEQTAPERSYSSNLNMNTIADYDEMKKTRPVDHLETHEFFQSLSDSSRFKEENLVQPLDKIEQPENDFAKTSELQFDPNLYNEDGIIKSEFELPDVSDKEEKVIQEEENTVSPQNNLRDTTAELNDTLFQMLSGNSSSFSEPEKRDENSPLDESSLLKEEDSFYSSLQSEQLETGSLFSERIEQKEADDIFEPVPLMPGVGEESIELPRPLPPYKPLNNTYDNEDIFAEADAAIKALQKEPEDLTKKTKEEHPVPSRLSTDELVMIIRAAELVNSAIKINEVLANIVEVARELTSADGGTLYLLDQERKELSSMVDVGNEIKEIRLKVGEGFAGYVAKTGQTLNIKDVQDDPQWNKDVDRSSGYKTKSMICFPIKNNKQELIAVLQLLNSQNGSFSRRDEIFLEAISIHSAIAIQNAKLLEKQLANERVNSLGKMANFLIQDIKKPVLVSKRYAEHLLNKDLPKETLQIIQMLLEQLVHVADLIQTTSSYSEGKTMLRSFNISLNSVLQDYASRVDTYVASRSCQIFSEFDKDVTVKLDVKEFFQCYMHIIKNACDAMPEGGSIFVSTKRDDKNVKILFKDNGLGIPEGYKDKIFEPFMSYGKKEGTGLGLAITKKIVEAHSATIDVEGSTGSGATFIITLPIVTMY